MEKLKWKKASEELPKNDEDILLKYWRGKNAEDIDVEVAFFCCNRFMITDEIEFTTDGIPSWDIECEYGRYNLLWVSLSDVLNLIEE